jgi:hypothetical protein
MCCSFVVTGRVHCVTREVPVSFWSVSNRCIAILTGLTGVIGRFETVDQFSKDEFCELRLERILRNYLRKHQISLIGRCLDPSVLLP